MLKQLKLVPFGSDSIDLTIGKNNWLFIMRVRSRLQLLLQLA